MLLDDLLHALLVATTDVERADVAARIARVDHVLDELNERLRGTDRDARHLALHLVTRLAPPPPELADGVVHCLRVPLDDDPLGDETALVLVACGQLAEEVCGFREVLAERARAIDAARGDRASIMQGLARETLAKVDAAYAAVKRRWQQQIDALAELVAAGRRDEAVATIEHDAAHQFYPELARAQRWEEVGHARRSAGDREGAQFCLARALEDYRWHASGATSGGEGMARMLDVHRLERELAPLA